MGKNLWLMPDYYEKFHCKADRCRHTCCRMWRIPVSRNAYHKLITMDCSPELSDRIARCFTMPEHVTDDHYRLISFNYLGDCPLLENGLCALHREKGETYLPDICNLFPRSHKRINGVNYAVCSTACEGIVELLYDCEKMNIQQRECDIEPSVFFDMPDVHMDYVDRIQEVFADRSISLKESIEQVCLLINGEEFTRDSAQGGDPLEAAMNIIDRLADERSILYDYYLEVRDRYVKDRGLYEKDAVDFEERFPIWMNFFENVLNNSMMYENFPFVDERFDQTDAFKGLCASYGLLRFMAIGYTAIHPNKDDLIDVVAALFHLIDHTAFYYNANILVDNAALLLKL